MWSPHRGQGKRIILNPSLSRVGIAVEHPQAVARACELERKVRNPGYPGSG
jgi:hypothetical protein